MTIVVLQSSAPRATTNPYLTQLYDAMPVDVSVEPFAWSTALRGRFDVLHVHWPEHLLRGSTRLRSLVYPVYVALILARCRVRRVAVVRTLHNERPHERGTLAERVLLPLVDRSTTLYVRLNRRTRPPTAAPVRTILHGDYTRWYAGHPTPDATPGRLLHVGLVRRYKGVEALLTAFDATGPDLELRVVGATSEGDGLRELVEDAVRRDARVTARLEHVDDATMAAEVGAAELVVLPYRRLHNSGVALLALSLGRPVLVPSGDVAADLAAEVGPGWVHAFDGDLRAEDLERVVADLRRTPPAAPPDLRLRGWDDLAAQHAEAFREAIALRRGSR